MLDDQHFSTPYKIGKDRRLYTHKFDVFEVVEQPVHLNRLSMHCRISLSSADLSALTNIGKQHEACGLANILEPCSRLLVLQKTAL